ncbi:MAG: CapA family protein [Actinomycetota bacterium]|nr:CapA family protein [Actinomycetota bacterium]
MGRHRKPSTFPAGPLVLAGGTGAAVVAVVVGLLVWPEAPAPVESEAVATSERTPAPALLPTTPQAPPSVTVAFAGDVHFTGRTEPLLDDPATAFGSIAQTLSAADIAMVNLETAITDRGVEEPKEFHFRTSPVALDALHAAGIDLTTMANNHAVDYGPLGLQDTLDAVMQSPIPVIGVGRDAGSAYAPHRVDVRGVTISFFAASQVPDHTYRAWTATDASPGIATTADQDRLIAGVGQASAAGDVVVVYLHWGIEDEACPTPEMEDLATELAAAGADAIVGTHAHRLLGAGYLDEPGSTAFVAYGLGNFLWWRSRAASDSTGVLTLTVQNGTVIASALTPAVIDDTGRPQPVIGPQVPDDLASFEELRDCAGLLPTPAV